MLINDVNQGCKNYMKSCTVCLHSKGDEAKAWEATETFPDPNCPWEIIAIDFIVDLPPSEGFTTILVMVDRLSKMAHFLPMVGTPSAIETAHIFIKEILRIHKLPSNIVSDRGVQFTFRIWRALGKALKVELCLSSAYHPQINRQTECTNQTQEQYPCCFSAFSQDDWVSLLPLVEFTYNNSVHSATNESPFRANYGLHPSCLLCSN